MSPDTKRRGQIRGQGHERTAAECLADLEYVQGLREAAKTPATWACVDLTVQAELLIPEETIKCLGGSRDDLLVMLLEAIEALRHPGNRNFARHTTALQWVNQELDWRMKLREKAEADRGRQSLTSLERAKEAKRENAKTRATKLETEAKALIDAHDLTKDAAYRVLDRRKGKKPGTVKKAITRARRAPR